MHANILPLVGVPLLAMTAVQGYVTMKLFQDSNCQTLVPGDGQTTVFSSTCDTNVGTGWSLALIIDNTGSPAGTLNVRLLNLAMATARPTSHV